MFCTAKRNNSLITGTRPWTFSTFGQNTLRTDCFNDYYYYYAQEKQHLVTDSMLFML